MLPVTCSRSCFGAVQVVGLVPSGRSARPKAALNQTARTHGPLPTPPLLSPSPRPASQGGTGVPRGLSLDALLAGAFGRLPGLQAEQLRLVHRLDKETTGLRGVGDSSHLPGLCIHLIHLPQPACPPACLPARLPAHLLPACPLPPPQALC